jgi:hypothetical protein
MESATSTLAGSMLIIFGIALCVFVFWLMAIVDILKSDFTNPGNKTAWLIVLLFLGPLGMLLYAFVGTRQKIKSDTKNQITERLSPQPPIFRAAEKYEKDDRDFTIR